MAGAKLTTKDWDEPTRSYAESLRNLTNADLWAGIEHTAATIEVKRGTPLWEEVRVLRAELLKLRRRLSAWFAWVVGELRPPPVFSAEPECPKCGTRDAKRIRTRYCQGGRKDSKAICFLRQDAQAEHMHRLCRHCGYEWLEACPGDPVSRGTTKS